MSVREYIGARYVPIFADPIEWDSSRTYEPLTIVQHAGNSYTSRQYVPTGIDIANETYWALTGNYNAQIEAYRQEVDAFDDRITANEEAIANLKPNAKIGSPSAGALQALYRCAYSYVQHDRQIVYRSGSDPSVPSNNAMSYNGLPSYVTDFDREGWAMNCSCFAQLCLLGVDWDHSRYAIGAAGNMLGAMGYCFNMWGTDITVDNYELYNTTKGMARRLLELGLLEKVNADRSNIYPGDVLFNWETAPAGEPTIDDIGHCRIVLASQLCKWDPGERTLPFALFAECRGNARPVTLKGRPPVQLDSACFVGHIPYQHVAEQPVRLVGTFDAAPTFAEFNQRFNTMIGGVMTLEFDFKPSSDANYIDILVDSTAPEGHTAVQSVTAQHAGVPVAGARHFAVPVNTYYEAYPEDTNVSRIRVRNQNHASGEPSEITNIRLYEGFGTLPDNVCETVAVGSLEALQSAIEANVSVSTSPANGYFDFILPFRCTGAFNVGGAAFAANNVASVHVHGIYSSFGAAGAYVDIEGQRNAVKFTGSAKFTKVGDDWVWTWDAWA